MTGFNWALAFALGFLIALAWVCRVLARLVGWIKRLRSGELVPAPVPLWSFFWPVAHEAAKMGKELDEARRTAEQEARLRWQGQSRWTPERLRNHVQVILHGRPFVLIANREPYTHVREGEKIRCLMPASGLVTAVEPILRACGGTWVASASGDADRETADAHGRLAVPPDNPAYTLRRIFLTEEEEEGYYYGFSNEGLWPLCHIAHTRPVFRIEDWQQYKKVNQKFAKATLDELAGTKNPFVLIQDYHYALLPKMIRDERPDARIALFWHIPWTSPEAFAICPWGREILQGMMGADLVGFHIQSHCNNFLETAERLLEARVDWDQFAVNRSGSKTVVKPFPISIAESTLRGRGDEQTPAAAREEVFHQLGLRVQWLGVGVDRIDYTKGIAERFRAIERFLEKYPEFRGKFSFVELGAPSRTGIKRYNDLGQELQDEADRINARFQASGWKPILFLKDQHNQELITRFYKAADICLVTSLHDGMNLVAKEFVATRTDRQGVLILSRFAGASQELRDALLVNPYDVDEGAEAIYRALTMTPEEQRSRMSRMHTILEDHNVYRWAADIMTELNRIHPDDSF